MNIYSRRHCDLPESSAPNAILIAVALFLGFGAALIFTAVAPLLDLNLPVIATIAMGVFPALLMIGFLVVRAIRPRHS